MDYDISPIDFWDYTIQEANDIIEARSKKQKHELQFRAMCGYNESIMVIQGMNNLFNKHPKEPQKIWELYPTLFEEPIELIKQRNAEIMKARLLEYAEAWNKKIGKE